MIAVPTHHTTQNTHTNASNTQQQHMQQLQQPSWQSSLDFNQIYNTPPIQYAPPQQQQPHVRTNNSPYESLQSPHGGRAASMNRDSDAVSVRSISR